MATLNDFLDYFNHQLSVAKFPLEQSLLGKNGTIKNWDKFLEVQNQYKGLCQSEVALKEAELAYAKGNLYDYMQKEQQ